MATTEDDGVRRRRRWPRARRLELPPRQRRVGGRGGIAPPGRPLGATARARTVLAVSGGPSRASGVGGGLGGMATFGVNGWLGLTTEQHGNAETLVWWKGTTIGAAHRGGALPETPWEAGQVAAFPDGRAVIAWTTMRPRRGAGTNLRPRVVVAALGVAFRLRRAPADLAAAARSALRPNASRSLRHLGEGCRRRPWDRRRGLAASGPHRGAHLARSRPYLRPCPLPRAVL